MAEVNNYNPASFGAMQVAIFGRAGMIVGGSVRVPGDKSITHRLLMLAAMTRGVSHIRRPLTSLDARSTARVLRQLGADVSALRSDSTVTLTGRGRFLAPGARLHCGNAGTTARLLAGLLAAHRFTAELTGDASLRRRPMRRVTQPLSLMGARTDPPEADRLPFAIRGGALSPLRWDLPVSSAQIKTCLLFAGLAGGVGVSLREPAGRSRDHTERLLRAMGYTVAERRGRVEFEPDGRLAPFEADVPADPSSAAFLIGAALLADKGELVLPAVGLNPTRVGFLAVLERMGAALGFQDLAESWGEPTGTVVVRAGALSATEVVAGEIPSLVDEVPMLAVLATRAAGVTAFRQVGELRVKESDRLTLLAENIRSVGGRAEVQREDLLVEGSDRPPRGSVLTEGDHRIAMAFSVLGTVRGARVAVDDPDCAEVSFPGFADALRGIRR
jgi:3-phosphoshikimate 1-carboxyvinyltransferase